MLILLYSQVNELKDETIHLKKQIASLRRQLRLDNGGFDNGQHTETPSEAFSPSSVACNTLPVVPLPRLATNIHPILSRQSCAQALPGFVLTSFGIQDYEYADQVDDLDQDEWSSNTSSYQPAADALSTSSDFNALPSMEEARSLIRSLLKSAKHGPSNLDKIIGQTQLEEDCRLVYGPDGLTALEYANNRFRCFITIYLAMCMAAAVNGENITADARANACRTVGMKELASVTSREDLVSQGAPNTVSAIYLANVIGVGLCRSVDASLRTCHP